MGIGMAGLGNLMNLGSLERPRSDTKSLFTNSLNSPTLNLSRNLILLLLAGEIATLHIVDIVSHGLRNCRTQVGITTQEAGRE